MEGIYHIKPLYKSFVWAGSHLAEEFNLEVKNTGTIYSVIAIPGELDNTVEETGEPLSVFYHTHKEVFGCKKEDFPVRMSITCNEGFQSYQLHPTDAYGLEHEGQRGKVSGSVTLKESSCVSEKKFGHTAKTLEEFKKMVENKEWDQLFHKVSVKDGDFLHTPAGVIHGGYGDGKIYAALGTNGDITYRFYDLDRNDPDRPLHIQEVYECISVPEMDLGGMVIHPSSEKKDHVEILSYYAKKEEYVAKKLNVNGKGRFQLNEFYFITNVSGEGMVNREPLRKGETLLVERNHGAVELDGTMELLLLSYTD